MTNIEPKNLYYQSLNKVTLENAIKEFKDKLKAGNALIYSPKYCKLLKLTDNGEIFDSNENPIELNYQKEHIFEARIFNENYELRWLQEKNGEGSAVLISDQEKLEHSEDVIDTIDQQYLLWGEKANTKLPQGWQKLSTARIGAIDIFIDNKHEHENMNKDERIYLHTREYIQMLDDYGNVGVIEERLIKLKVKKIIESKNNN